jgi:hypothetical protein
MSDEESRFTAKNRVPKELVKLSGESLTIKGEKSRSKYFDFLKINLDDYSDIAMTPEQAHRVSGHLRKLSTGATAMTPMYCGGDHCPFSSRCPLHTIGKAPLGKQCLIETELMKEFIIRAIEEYDIDPANFTEVGFVNELAEIEILLMRLNMSISKPENAELVIDQTVGVGQDGTPLIQKQLSPFMEQKERLYARRARVIKLMVGDRQEKYKKEAALKIKLDQDPSSRMAATRKKLDELKSLNREIDGIVNKSAEKEEGFLSPQDIIDAED